MHLRPCKKGYREDTHRAFPPEETLKRIEGKMAGAGITRVADITNLDRIGIPVFSSIRPVAEEGAITVYNGKGATPIEARISAMMEGIERCSAELDGREPSVGSYSKISLEENVLDPAELILPRGQNPNLVIPWVRGYDLMAEEEILVPAHAVFHPLSDRYARLFRTNTNGLASGNTLEEAVFHGLAEVIERDAWSLVEASRDTGPVIRNVRDGLVKELLGKFEAAQVSVILRDISSDVGIPTFAAVSDDIQLKDPALLTIGMGTHTSANVAMLRALTEVAQSRLTQIHGAREDTNVADFRKSIGYERAKRLNRYWFEIREERDYSDLLSFDSNDFLEDIHFLLRRLEDRGFSRAIVVDLTRETIGVPVIRVIVPGLEVYAMDGERIGERCRSAAKDRRLPRSEPAA
ncbi:MAG TPA: YcaO-related McrA-glycine thioamidation protein [Methanomicrobiales archaeon]|nr:YcaO-related McrA-glycine thioamidation protein [Methanomicrobiales archaeon]